MHSALAALVFGIILFFLIVVGIEYSLRSFEKTLSMLGSRTQFFEKLRVDHTDSSHRSPEVREHIRRINVIRYALHLGIVVAVAFVLFSRMFSPLIWVGTIVILFIVLAALDLWWRRLIARG
jgi:uncharacterized iron-regulated membrane protein